MEGDKTLELYFLGKTRFICNGVDITDQVGNKAAALTALMLLHRKGIRRERLTGYLWPDSSTDAAKYNLRYNLWQLKKAIEPDQKGREFLITTRDYCAINFEYSFWCDVLEISEAEPQKDSSIKQLLTLSDSLKGDFFEGSYFNGCDDFNEFILLQRTNLESTRVKLLKRLADLYEGAGNYSGCLEVLMEILIVEPYDETTAGKTMKVYVACGNRGGAVRYYKNFCSKLICNLGIQPSEELKNLYTEIKAASPEVTEKAIELSSWCMEGVSFFWAADVVEGLLQKGLPEDKQALQKVEVMDLAWLVPRAASYFGLEQTTSAAPTGGELATPGEVRIVRAFLHLLDSVCSQRRIRLVIHRKEYMDDASKRIFEYLLERKPGGLEIAGD